MRIPGSMRPNGAAVALVDQAVVSATGFLTTVLLVRELGLATFGVFSLVWLLVVLGVALEQALVSQPLLTIAQKSEGEERSAYLGAVLALQGVYTLVCAAAASTVYAFVLAHWDDEVLAGTFLPVVSVVVVKQAHAFVRAAFFARGERLAALANDLIAYPAQLVVLAILWGSGRLDLASTLWAIAGCSGLATLLGLLHYREKRTTAAALAEAAGRHWRFSRWLAAMQVARFFASNAFLVAAGALLGVGAVGVIKAAHTVVGVLHVVFLSMENVVPVSAARLYVARNTAALVRYVGRIGTRGMLLTAAVTGALALFPRLVLEPLYGDAVSDDLVVALRALAALYVFGFAISLLQIAFRTVERTRPVFVAYMVNTLIAVTVAHPVVERFGFTGALLGMVGQQALMAGLLLAAFVALVMRDASPEVQSAR